MTEDKFKAHARGIIEGCTFSMEDAIADDLREADALNQGLPGELLWALDMLERQAKSSELIEKVREKQKLLWQKETD